MILYAVVLEYGDLRIIKAYEKPEPADAEFRSWKSILETDRHRYKAKRIERIDYTVTQMLYGDEVEHVDDES